MLWFALLSAFLCVRAFEEFDYIKVDTNTRTFVDTYKRTRIFHGVNAVYKIAPWHPTLSGYDSTTTLSDIDADNLKKWGFNIVRLGVMWPGVEPRERGVYDQVYLDNIETIVKNLEKSGIHVILDFHQDIWHRKFCGEGVPDYVYETCKAHEPAGTKQFPLPAVNFTYPVDADGNPTLEACLSSMFATYYMSAEVGAGFQCLYDNVDNLWDGLAGYWKAVVQRFATAPNVLGYELINEPWVGDAYANPKNLLPEYAETHYLQPLYEHLHQAIRQIDKEKIIFFEGLTIDYWPNGFTAGPGGVSYNDRQVLAYHIYCPIQNPSVKIEKACELINEEFLAMRRKDAERIGTGMIMTEFGAAEDNTADLFALEQTAELADKWHQSWMYWQFKYYQDITTCTPEGESLYTANNTICTNKINILSRTYPTAVAGTINDYSFNKLTAEFTLNYIPLTSFSTDTSKEQERTTVIYWNQDVIYKRGINVEITGTGVTADSFTIKCPALLRKDYSIQVIQQQVITGGDDNGVTVKISHCGTSQCTCHNFL